MKAPVEDLTTVWARGVVEAVLGDFVSVRAGSRSSLVEYGKAIMWMPAGVHEIFAGYGLKGEAKANFWIKVDAECAAVAQASLRNFTAAYPNQRAFFDREHEAKDATAWPEEFFWSDTPQPGIYARCELSSLGQELITGKVQRGFSPQFKTDADLPKRAGVKPGQLYTVPEGRRGSQSNPARIVSIDFPSAGGFTNFPAFQDNLPLWAKAAEPLRQKPKPPAATSPLSATMTKEKLAELQAQITAAETAVGDLIARSTGSAEDAETIQARRVELDGLKQQLEAGQTAVRKDELEQALVAVRAKDARSAVAAAVRRGALPAKDNTVQARWEKLCTEDPDNIGLLNQLRGSPALEPVSASGARLVLPSASAHITREASLTVLNAMAAISARSQGLRDNYAQQRVCGQEFGDLYEREIIPRLKEGDPLPLRGANSLGTLAETLVATRTLENLMLSLPLLSRISTNFSDQIVSYGDTLKTRFVGTPTVVSYNTATGWADSDMNTFDVSMTYDKVKGVQIMLNAQEVAGTVRRLFDEIAPQQSYALGKEMVTDLYGVIVLAAFTGELNQLGVAATTIEAGLGTFGRSTLIDIGGALDDNGNPDMGRFCLLARPYYSALKKDQTIIQLAAFQRREIIEKGMLPDVEDFDVIKAVNLPATNIGGKTLKGFGGTRSSLCLASRLSTDYLKDNPGASGVLQTVTLADTGISGNIVLFVDNKLGRSYRRLELIYSVAAGQELAGQILTDV